MDEKELETNSLQEEAAILKAYKELEKNSVPKEKYEQDIKALKEKNELYLRAITEGEQVNVDKDNNVSLEDKIKELTKFKGTNLAYWEKTTSAIDSMLTSIPEEEITKVTGAEGLEEIIKVNEGMKKMVADSNGNPDMFRAIYSQRVKESAPQIASEIDKSGGLVNHLSKNNKK